MPRSAPPYNDIRFSETFKFLIGPEKVTAAVFVLHKDAVSYHSKALDVLMNGVMVEARDGYVWLRDVEECTFQRFSQFVYTGEYQLQQPDINEPLSSNEKVFGIQAPDCTGDEPRHDWTQEFLLHAKMYVLGDMFNISDLSNLALRNLREILSFAITSDEGVGDYVELARYVFKNTRNDNKKDLRAEVTGLIAFELHEFVDDHKFIALLDEIPEFAKALVLRIPHLDR